MRLLSSRQSPQVKPGSNLAEPDSPLIYQPAPADGRAKRLAGRLRSRVTAPLGGSRLIFPRLLARSIAGTPDTAMRPFLVPSRHAQRFFGDSLVFWIDPAALRLRLPDRVRVGTADIWLSDRFIDDGDWSGVLRPIEALAEHRDMLELVRFGEGYSEMPIFLELARRIRAGNPATRYGRVLNSEESLHDYFRYFLQLIDSIRDRGFQRQSLLPASRGEGVEVRGKWAARQRDIGVAIGADGSVVRFLGGRHRTAIAQALSVPAVPVEIRLVHRDFLATQARTRTVGPAEALLQWVGEQTSARRP